MSIEMTTFENVQSSNGRAVNIISGVPSRRLFGTDGDGMTVKIMAWDVSEAEEKALNATHSRVFETQPGSVTPDDAYRSAREYAESLCREMNLPLIDEDFKTFRK